MDAGTPGKIGFAGVLRIREFRWLWFADVQSEAGNQLARVALSVLVYSRTSSAVLTAAIYALTFLPAIVAGPIVGHLADNYPRRTLMVVSDLVRVVLVGVMALPGLPLWALTALIVAVVVVGVLFTTAESAAVADILHGEVYAVASSLRTASGQAAQVLGFAVGGLAIAALGARPALAVDAATFAVSATLIRLAVEQRQVVVDATGEPLGLGAGVRAVAGNPSLRRLLGFSWLLGILVIPEGLAAPYAAERGAGAAGVGLLLAAAPAGTTLGAVLVSRIRSPEARGPALPILATAAGLPLVACLIHPGVPVTVALWFLSGLAMAYQVLVVVEFMGTVAPDLRGRAVGIASSGLLAAQGVGLLAGGIIAQFSSPTTAVVTAGVAAMALASFLAVGRISGQTGMVSGTQ